MSCENPISISELLALAVKKADTNCLSIKVVVESHGCNMVCEMPAIETLLGYIFNQAGTDVSINCNLVGSVSNPVNFFDCDNKNTPTMEALMSCFTIGEGALYLNILQVGTATCGNIDCLTFDLETELRKRIYIYNGCVAIGVADIDATDLSCNEINFAPTNILSLLFGVDNNGNDIVRIKQVSFPEDTCLLEDLTAAYYDCGDGGFAFLISRTGSNVYFGAGYTIVYEQSSNNILYTPLSEGGNKSATVNVDTEWIKITITCLENNSTRVIVLGKADAGNATFIDYLLYSVDGIIVGYVPVSATIYAGENSTVNLQSLSPDVNAAFSIVSPFTNLGVATSIDIENEYGGPVVINVVYEDAETPGCTGGTGAFNIVWIDAPNISIDVYSFCSQEDLDNASPISVNDDFDTYQWYKNGVLLPGETAYALDVSLYGIGTYYCFGTVNGVTQQSGSCVVALYNITWAPQIRIKSPFDQYYFDGSTYHVASDLTGCTLECFDLFDFIGGFPALTQFEWLTYTPPTIGLDEFFANGAGSYVCRVTLPGSIGGCIKDTNEIVIAFDINAGLFVWNCLFPYGDSVIQDVFDVVDNGGTWDITLQSGFWNEAPTYPAAYNPYTPNGTWSRILPTPALLQTGGSSITVNTPGWYAYKPEAPLTEVMGVAPIPILNYTLLGPSEQWKPYSLTVTYIKDAVEKYLCCVDGGGSIHNLKDDANNIVGTFNSATGEIDIIFIEFPDNGTDITVTYGINCAFGEGFLILIQ